MATYITERLETDHSPEVSEVVVGVDAGRDEAGEHNAVVRLEEALRKIVPADRLDEGQLVEMTRALEADIGAANATEVPERRETVLAVQLAECFCCGAPVYAKGEPACHVCMGAKLQVADGFAIPEEVGAPQQRGHKWAKCKACNRRARRAITAVIRSEARGRNVGKQKKTARARAPK